MCLSRFESTVTWYSPVWRELSQVMTHRDLQVLSMTSKCLKDLVGPFLRRQQNVDIKLNKFVVDPIGLRCMLRETEAVVAGEFARTFFLGSQSSDLEFVLSDPRLDRGFRMNILTKYLTWCEGYRPIPFISRQRGLEV